MHPDLNVSWREWAARAVGLKLRPAGRRRAQSLGRIQAAEVRQLLSANPVINAQQFGTVENSPLGTFVGNVAANDPDAGASSLSFDGVDDFVSVPGSASLNVGTATSGANSGFTVEGWFNFAQTNVFAALVTRPFSTGVVASNQMFFDGGSTLYGTVQDNFVTASFSPVVGRWYHIGMTFDNAANTAKLFVDGNEVGSTTITVSPAYTTGNPLLIGADKENGSLSNFFPGKIDDVRVWNVARTQAQIAGAMQQNLAATTANLIGYWQFNAGSGTSAVDTSVDAAASNPANDGTLAAAPATPTWSTDAPPPLAYSITAGNGAGALAIDTRTGKLTVANSAALDYEASPSIPLTVQVKDFDGLTASATVTVNLTNVKEPSLIDVNDTPTSSHPGYDANYNLVGNPLEVPGDYITIGSTTYFAANDGLHGTELWKTDGTPGGTQLVSDLVPGTGSSGPNELNNFNGTLYFYAYNPSTGISNELWKSDGTAAGTVPLNPGIPVDRLRVVGTNLFFRRTDTAELWLTNGTAAGTKLVKDLDVNSAADPQWMTNVGGTLYFSASDSTNGRELWKSNGTAAGTVLVKNIRNGQYSSSPQQITNAGGLLVFTADDGAGRELWVSNGVSAGTLIKDIRGPGGNGSDPAELTAAGGTVYFRAYEDNDGWELWKSNGTVAGTALVQDIYPSPNSSYPNSLAAVGSNLFFAADDGSGSALWKTDGTTTAPVPGGDVADIPSQLTNVNGTLFFVAYDDANVTGKSLWKSDGATTTLVADLTPGDDDWQVQDLVARGSQLLFKSNLPATNWEWYQSNGTTAGTGLLKEINATTLDASFSSDPTTRLAVGNTLYYYAHDGANWGLWKSAGANKTLIMNTGGNVGSLAEMNGTIYFTAPTNGNGGGNIELWKSDGTPQGTSLVDGATKSYYPRALTNVNGTLFFAATHQTGINKGEELWKTDGTAAGTVFLKDIRPGSTGSNITEMTNFNGTLLFSANNGTNGQELWKSNGTAAGTVQVKDINSGVNASTPTELTLWNGFAYFSAFTDAEGQELWRSNGTSAGTTLVAFDPGSGPNYSPHSLEVSNNQLYFIPGSTGYGELYVTNGTQAGTVPVEAPGTGSYSIDSLTDVNGTLYYEGYDQAIGGNPSLWRWNGTNTAPVTSAAGEYNPQWMTNVNGTLFYTAVTANEGREVWKLEGGTPSLVQDLNAGATNADPGYLVNANGNLFFVARTPQWGNDQFVLLANQAPTVTAPASVSGTEDINFTFSGGNTVSVGDVDAQDGSVQVTLTAANGLVTLSQTTGLTFNAGANGQATMTFTGTLANVNAALANLVYAPTQHFNGNTSLQVGVNDLGNLGVGGPLTVLQTVNLSFSAVNDAPTTTGPASAITINEDTVLTFTGANALTVADVDAASAIIQAQLTASQGIVKLSTLTGLTVTAGANNSITVTVQGTVSAINTALGNATYTPTLNAAGAKTVTLNVSDLGNTGSGGVKTASRTVNVTITAVNDAPVNAVPAAVQNTVKGSTLTFNAANGNLISVSDVDITTNPIKMTLTASNGVLTLSGVTGLTFTAGANGTSTMTFTGTVTNVNAALNGMTYQPGAFSGTATISVTANDQGKAGTGGAQQDVDTITVNVAGINVAPTISFPSAPTINEDASLVFSSGNGNAITVGDVDAGSAPVKLTLWAVNGQVTVTGFSNVGFLQVTDTLANLNALLNGLLFQPISNANGAAGIQISVDDQGNTGGAAQVTTSYLPITVTAVNDAPTIGAPTAAVTVPEDGTKKFWAATGLPISIADVDGNVNVSVTLAVADSTKGTLTLATTAGLSFSVGDGTADPTMTFSGTVSAINAALNGLLFKGAANKNGTTSLTVAVDDLGNVGTGGNKTANASIPLKITAMNDAPTVTAPGTTLIMTAGTPYAFTGGALAVGDVDASGQQVQLTLRYNQGAFAFGNMTGVTEVSNLDGIWTLSGTVANLNTALNTLTFTPDVAGSDTLEVIVNDLGNTGVGGPLQTSKLISINVAASFGGGSHVRTASASGTTAAAALPSAPSSRKAAATAAAHSAHAANRHSHAKSPARHKRATNAEVDEMFAAFGRSH